MKNMIEEYTTRNKIMTGIMEKMQEELSNVIDGGDIYVCRQNYASFIDGTENVLVTDEVEQLAKLMKEEKLTLTDFTHYARLPIDDSRDICDWLDDKIEALDGEGN